MEGPFEEEDMPGSSCQRMVTEHKWLSVIRKRAYDSTPGSNDPYQWDLGMFQSYKGAS